MNTVEKLQFRVALTAGGLRRWLDELWFSEHVSRLFPEYLITLQQIIRASVPLMEAARQEAAKLDDTDPLRGPLTDYLQEHIEEERHHDDWTLDDLESAGYGRNEVLARIPGPLVASLVGAQYYWIHHHHPVGLLGYIYVLEGDPGSKELYDELETRSKLPSALFRTYRMHGELDPDHIAELATFINALPLSDDQFSLIGISAMNTMLGLSRCVEDILASQAPAAAAVAAAR